MNVDPGYCTCQGAGECPHCKTVEWLITDLQSQLSAAQKRIDWALVQVRAMLDEFADAAHIDRADSLKTEWPRGSMAYLLVMAHRRLTAAHQFPTPSEQREEKI